MTKKAMKPIPYVDIRGRDLPGFCEEFLGEAHALLNATRGTFGIFSHGASMVLLPLADRYALRWMEEQANPYLEEIHGFARHVKSPGVYALNLSYEWGCTSGAFSSGKAPDMLRVLDWPFPGLGESTCVLHQKGQAGDYYNVSWPALSGVFQAMAPKRFAAAINQAPMRCHHRTFFGDWYINRRLARTTKGLPPAHLLRKVFEEARDYQDARDMLTHAPICIPVLFTLSGAKDGEACIIERLEDTAFVRDIGNGAHIGVANTFQSPLRTTGKGWRPRAIDNTARESQISRLRAMHLRYDHLDWLTGPIINPLTRLVMVANAQSGAMTLQGREKYGPATEVFRLPDSLQAGDMIPLA